MVQFPIRPLLCNSASLMKLRARPKATTVMSTKQITLLQAVASLEQCMVVARRMCLSPARRQAAISLTDSSDNGRAGMIAWK